MNQGRIIVITGSPGTGKTTTASIVAKESDMDKSVHMHTDDFFHYLSKGAIPPHLPESNKQNLVVIEAFLEAAKRYARGGYDVIVDGIVGPWFLEPWKALAQEDYEVHYIVLRASKKETMKRAVERSKLDRKTNIELNSVYTRSGQNSTPNSNATNLHSSQKRCCSFCISSSNASPTFQVQKSIFHQMTKPIQVTVILPLLLAISFSRNDDIHSSISGISNDLIGVIPTIGQ